MPFRKFISFPISPSQFHTRKKMYACLDKTNCWSISRRINYFFRGFPVSRNILLHTKQIRNTHHHRSPLRFWILKSFIFYSPIWFPFLFLPSFIREKSHWKKATVYVRLCVKKFRCLRFVQSLFNLFLQSVTLFHFLGHFPFSRQSIWLSLSRYVQWSMRMVFDIIRIFYLYFHTLF